VHRCKLTPIYRYWIRKKFWPFIWVNMVHEETLIGSGQSVWNDTWLINLLSTWYSRALSLVILYFLLTGVAYLKLKEPVGVWLLCDAAAAVLPVSKYKFITELWFYISLIETIVTSCHMIPISFDFSFTYNVFYVSY